LECFGDLHGTPCETLVVIEENMLVALRSPTDRS
jgi:hypothetical protein